MDTRTSTLLGLIILSMIASATAQEIFDAARNGNLGKVQELIEQDPQLVNRRDETGRTPLHWAARGVHFELLQYLADRGADVNARDANGTMALHSVAARGHLAACRCLVEHGAAVDVKNSPGVTPFYYAALQGKREVLEYLLAHGANKADLEMRDTWGRTPLCSVARDGGNPETLKVLLALGADVNAADSAQDTPILLAAWRPYKDAVNVLLDAGAELFVNTPRGEELLYFAAGGLERLFDRMVEKGASLTILNKDGGTLLHSAAGGDSLKIVESLVGQGFDVNRQDRFGWAPLHIAAEQGRRETIAYLVRKGADVNVRNLLGQTPYNIAREREDAELAELLISLQADTAAPKFPKIQGKYLGRPRPGLKPEEFAPGIVSHRYRPHSTVAVSPDGEEIFWNPMIESRGGGYSYGYLMSTRIENGCWTYPRKVAFSEKDFRDDHPVFSADGRRLYFISRRPGGGAGSSQGQEGRIWYVDKSETGWGEPILFEALPPPVGPSVTMLTFSLDEQGSCYSALNGDIYCARCTNGKYAAPEKLGANINTDAVEGSPLICPKGDYLVFLRGVEMSPVVCFKKRDGGWSEAVSLKEKIGGKAWNFSLSGNYLMVGGQRWVDVALIEELRPVEAR